MYKVILADDEEWVVYGLLRLINWEDHDFTIIATARDGYEALEKVKQLKPDLLISDIRMPGMDGITLVQKVKEISETEVIFISGYADFEHAQKALRLGALDFIRKQVEADELSASLDRTAVYLASKRDISVWQKYFRLFDEKNKIKLNEVFVMFNMSIEAEMYQLILLRMDEGNEEIETGLIRNNKQEVAATLNIQIGVHIVGMLIAAKKIETEYEKFIPESASVIGLSSIRDGEYFFYDLYLQSQISAMTYYYRTDRVLSPYEEALSNKELNDKIEVLNHKEDNVRIVKKHIHVLIMNAASMQFDTALTLHNLVIKFLYRRFGKMADHLEARTIDFYFSNHALSKGLFQPIIEFLNELEKEPAQGTNISALIHYIDEHFTNDIHLRDLAQHFYLTENYLSYLIKQECGKTFTEYILEKRIKYAQELLINSTLTIREIAEKIGYSEYSYFSKIFRKKTGLTLTDYRKKGKCDLHGTLHLH